MSKAFDLSQVGRGHGITADLGAYRNKIINGDFEISQRGTTFSALGYTVDRWKFSIDGNGTGRAGTLNQYIDEDIAAEIGSNAPQHLNWTETASGSGYSFKVIQQSIENVRTLAGRLVTVTFWAVMPVGGPHNLLLTLRQVFGVSGSPSNAVDASETIAIPGDNVWRKYSVTLQLPSVAGKILTPGNHLAVIFHLPPNRPFTFGIKRVSLVEGDATAEEDPFSPRHIQQEMALCQRYFEIGTVSFSAYCAAGSGMFYRQSFLNQKRATPSITYFAGSVSNVTIYDVRDADTVGLLCFATATTTNMALVQIGWTADAEL